MNEYLEPLALVPGVRLAALISPDGVPIALLKGAAAKALATSDRSLPDAPEDFAAYAGLAVGWLGQVARATDPLTWNRPRRAVLRGTRGTLIMSRADNAILMVITDQGLGAEELRLPMNSALARMQRHLRGASTRSGPAIDTAPVEPRGALAMDTAPVEPHAALPKDFGALRPSSSETQDCRSELSGDN